MNDDFLDMVFLASLPFILLTMLASSFLGIVLLRRGLGLPAVLLALTFPLAVRHLQRDVPGQRRAADRLRVRDPRAADRPRAHDVRRDAGHAVGRRSAARSIAASMKSAEST